MLRPIASMQTVFFFCLVCFLHYFLRLMRVRFSNIPTRPAVTPVCFSRSASILYRLPVRVCWKECKFRLLPLAPPYVRAAGY